MDPCGLARYLQAVNTALEVHQVTRLHLLGLAHDSGLPNDALHFTILALLLSGSGLRALSRELGRRFEAERSRLARNGLRCGCH